MYDFYIAAPVVGVDIVTRGRIDEAIFVLKRYIKEKYDGQEAKIYDPKQLKIPNAWNMPQAEWSRCVFTEDVLAIDQSECIVVFDFGRNVTCGTAWEAGYAFAKEKRILLIVMPDVREQSLMMRNGCTHCVKYADFITGNFYLPNYSEEWKNETITLN